MYEPTVGTDETLRLRRNDQLFLVYHENSKLPRRPTTTAKSNAIQRFFATRGFRSFKSQASVPLDEKAGADTGVEDLFRRRRSRRLFGGAITLDELSYILHTSLGCTTVVVGDESETSHALRAWPSAGGLYPLDVYVVVANVTGLAEGLYYFNPIKAALEALNAAAPAEILAEGYFDQSFAKAAAAAIFFVAVFERTTSKYGERGYRLVLLDAGHAAQNVLLCAEQKVVSATAVAGFFDDGLAKHLAIDNVDEAVVHSVLLGRPA